MTNPIDDYLSAKQKTAAAARADEHELWRTWKANPNPQTLEPLLKKFEPMFEERTRRWKPPSISPTVFQADLVSHAIKAFHNYDPDRGAALKTHLTTRLQKGLRTVHNLQNMARIPEQKAELIGPINSAADSLRDELGRPPTPQEIGQHIGVPHHIVSQVQRMRQIKDIVGSSFESDPVPHASAREQEVLSMLHPALKPDEREVFNYLYGQNGKPRLVSTGAIAQAIGKSPSHVSRRKKAIEAEYKKYI
jgi:DNA-directed RNA polymerase specialized sigma subunit